MVLAVQALSISRSVLERLPTQPAPGRVLAVFQRACLLLPGTGEPVSLVLPEIGNGPLNIVVQDRPGCLNGLAPGMAAQFSGHRLQAGDVEVDLATACGWEPRPPWDSLRTHVGRVVARLGALQADAALAAPAGSLLSLLPADSPLGQGLEESWRLAIWRAGNLMRIGWAGGEEKARAAAAQLAGLGRGLTPAGDDFLAGVMLWAWLAHPAPRAFCQALLYAAAPRTTALSAAVLRAAAHGECSAAWHKLLDQLAAPGDLPVTPGAVGHVLSYGHTSGADTLAGFLWLPGGDPYCCGSAASMAAFSTG